MPSVPSQQKQRVPSAPVIRNLIVVLGDQLNDDSAAFDGFDPSDDAVWMAEVRGESEYVWTAKARIAVFLSAMRHFRDRQRNSGRRVIYRTVDEKANRSTLDAELAEALRTLRPQRVIWVEAGEHRVEEALQKVSAGAAVHFESRPDRHFLASREDFKSHALGRKQLRMEYFYREMRKRHRVLLTPEGEPEGGEWNFDEENRGAFPKDGPGRLPAPRAFTPDACTREVLALVNSLFAKHPGSCDAFDWPVTPEEAELAWQDFLRNRLPRFGEFQDAMWTGEPWLYHARISAALNLKLISPLKLVRDVEHAYRQKRVPLAAAEGFIRQVLGWREYVRGIYWRYMPEYLDRNALNATEQLPGWYWTGDTPMACLRDTVRQTLKLGYAHHIQRLMVTGLYALLHGVDPKQVHAWYLAVYVDAVEWVELPNTLGMSQYADGGIMASKPYAATGKYIQRMSNYCEGCQFSPDKAEGKTACPFTTLYWDFLLRHEERLRHNPRMALQIRNLSRLDNARRKAIQERAAVVRAGLPSGQLDFEALVRHPA